MTLSTLDSFWKQQITTGRIISCKICEYKKYCRDYKSGDGCFVVKDNGKIKREIYQNKIAEEYNRIITENWVSTEICLFGAPT